MLLKGFFCLRLEKGNYISHELKYISLFGLKRYILDGLNIYFLCNWICWWWLTSWWCCGCWLTYRWSSSKVFEPLAPSESHESKEENKYSPPVHSSGQKWHKVRNFQIVGSCNGVSQEEPVTSRCTQSSKKMGSHKLADWQGPLSSARSFKFYLVLCIYSFNWPIIIISEIYVHVYI